MRVALYMASTYSVYSVRSCVVHVSVHFFKCFCDLFQLFFGGGGGGEDIELLTPDMRDVYTGCTHHDLTSCHSM